MAASTFTMTATDGASIHVSSWVPEGEVRGVVQLIHGMAEHTARYARLAEKLNAAGWAVYGDDHRGHGRTAPSSREQGYWGPDGWNRISEDLHQLNRLAAERHPGKPIALIAHSMGSFFAQRMLYRHPECIAGAVMSASNGKPPPIAKVGLVVAKLERMRLGPSGRSGLLNTMSFGEFNKAFRPARTPFDWLSRDPAEVDKYIADPACGWVASAQFWCDLLPGLEEISQPANQARVPNDMPIFIIAGSEDPVSQQTRGLKQLLDAYRAAGKQRVTHKFYQGARHEIFNETNRDEVTADVLAFLDGLVKK